MSESPTLSPRAELRLVAGFFVVPPSIAALTFLGYLAIWDIGGPGALGSVPFDPVDSALSLATGVGVIAVVVTVFGAVPIVAWLNRRRALTLRTLLLVGAILGNLPFILIVLAVLATNGRLSSDVARVWDGSAGAMRATALGFGYGVVSASLFWLVAVWRQPQGSDVMQR